MLLIENDLILHCDVDDTIILWKDDVSKPGKGKIEIVDPYDGVSQFVYPHKKHIKLLKDFKARGYHITLWSGAGFKWVEAVVKALSLETTIDIGMTKNIKFMDDLQANEVLGSRIYLDDK